MKITYCIRKEVDLDKCIKRVKKVYKGAERDWLLKLYNCLFDRKLKEFFEMFHNPPRSKESGCSFNEFIDIPVIDFLEDISYHGGSEIQSVE